ncbi:MAG TPA: ABC transporter permease [Polyangiaceae bacterium]
MNTLNHVRYVLSKNPLARVASVAFAILVALALFGPSLVPYDPLATHVGPVLDAPSARHWFGTDHVGRDIFSRVIVAARLDLAIALGAVGLSLVCGVAIGCLAGFYGGWFDRLTGRVIDSIMAFPLFVLAMGIVSALGNTLANVVYATALINLPFYARLSRAEVAQCRRAEYVDAALLSGNSRPRVIFRHLLPNVLPTIAVQASLNLGWAVLNAAGLSFIGLGVRPPAAEWGIMVAEGAQYVVSGQWWGGFFPGLALMFAVLCFNFMGDGLRDVLDPRQRT